MEQIKEEEKPLHCKHSCNILRALMGRNIGLLYYKCCKSNVKILESIAERELIAKEHINLKYDLPVNSKATFLITFSPDGTKVATTLGDHNISVNDVASRKILRILSGHPRTPWCISFHPKLNNILASGCLGGHVHVWDIQVGNSIWNTEFNTVIASVAFHPIKKLLVVATSNKIYFYDDWDQSKSITCITTELPENKVRYVGFDNSGKKFLTGIGNRRSKEAQCNLRQIATYTASTHVVRRARQIGHNFPYSILEALDDRGVPIGTRHVGVDAGTYCVQAWDFSKEKLPDISNLTENVVVDKCRILNDASICISSDDTFLAANFCRAVGVFSLRWETLGEELFWVDMLNLSVISVSISPTQEHLVVGLANSLSDNAVGKYTMGTIYRLMQKQQQNEKSKVFFREYLCFAEEKKMQAKPLLSCEPWTPKCMSVNCIKWAPQPGQGFIYSTNYGQLAMLT